jgi:hypothetical protein
VHFPTCWRVHHKSDALSSIPIFVGSQFHINRMSGLECNGLRSQTKPLLEIVHLHPYEFVCVGYVVGCLFDGSATTTKKYIHPCKIVLVRLGRSAGSSCFRMTMVSLFCSLRFFLLYIPNSSSFTLPFSTHRSFHNWSASWYLTIWRLHRRGP